MISILGIAFAVAFITVGAVIVVIAGLYAYDMVQDFAAALDKVSK